MKGKDEVLHIARGAKMSEPKVHHYVPQFYLRRFADADGRLWVWDRDRDRTFAAAPSSIASESNFYLLPELAGFGHDPLTLEKQFSGLESDMSAMSGQWLELIRAGKALDRIPIPKINRELASQFMVLQFLRTADTRSLLTRYAAADIAQAAAPSSYVRSLHAEVLWDKDLVDSFRQQFESSTWVFAKNETGTPYVTSDNPLAFRTSNNRQWTKAAMLNSDSYAVYPLAPDVVLYCYPRRGRWNGKTVEQFDCRISPVLTTSEMIVNENSAQVFMASRFVVSNNSDFTEERRFAKTVSTDAYAPRGDKVLGSATVLRSRNQPEPSTRVGRAFS
jgi:hypothetical protein